MPICVSTKKDQELKSYDHGNKKKNLLEFENMKPSYVCLLKSAVVITYVHKVFDPPSKRWRLVPHPMNLASLGKSLVTNKMQQTYDMQD